MIESLRRHIMMQQGGGIIPLSAIEGKLSFFAESESLTELSGHNIQYKSNIKSPYDAGQLILDTILSNNNYRYYLRTSTAQRIYIWGAQGGRNIGFAGGDILITINGDGRYGLLSCQELNISNYILYSRSGVLHRNITPGTVEGGKFYFYKSDINGVPRHNIIPVLANGECNLYDTITDQFVPFTHEGTLIPIY